MEHRRPSSNTSEVSRHIHQENPDHKVDITNTSILTTEPKWFERGVKEAIYIRANKPTLNRDGGRYMLPPVWHNTIDRRIGPERTRRGTRTAARGAQSSD